MEVSSGGVQSTNSLRIAVQDLFNVYLGVSLPFLLEFSFLRVSRNLLLFLESPSFCSRDERIQNELELLQLENWYSFSS
jgi:hypothetical protein